MVPFEDWSAAARAALAFLHRTVGLDVWMVTHVDEPHQVVLHAHPAEVVPQGASIRWDRSFCRSMVTGAGPRVATVAAATPAYRDLQTGLPHAGGRLHRRPAGAPATARCSARCAGCPRAPSRGR